MVKYCKLQIANCKLQIAEGTATYRVLPTACRFTIYNLHFAFCIFQFFSVGFVLSAAIFAAEAPPAKQKLLDRTPFDEIVLNQASGGTKFEVLPLNLPQGALGALPQQGKLKVRLLDRPTEEFEVAWANVAQLR